MAEQSFSINVELLKDQLNKEQEDDILMRNSTSESGLRTSVFSTNSPVFPDNKISSPEITFLELMKDGLGNPYVQVNWRISKADVDSRSHYFFCYL